MNKKIVSIKEITKDDAANYDQRLCKSRSQFWANYYYRHCMEVPASRIARAYNPQNTAPTPFASLWNTILSMFNDQPVLESSNMESMPSTPNNKSVVKARLPR